MQEEISQYSLLIEKDLLEKELKERKNEIVVRVNCSNIDDTTSLMSMIEKSFKAKKI